MFHSLTVVSPNYVSIVYVYSFHCSFYFLAIAIADWQSQCIDTDGVGFISNGMFGKKFFNHSASLPAISRATNSYYIVDLAIIVCLDDLHVTAPPMSVNT